MSRYDDRKEKIGKRIKEERNILGLKPKEFLSKIYKSEQSTKSLTSWENGDRLPDLDSLVLMADLFDCDLGYLLGDYDERKRDTADIVEVTGLSGPAADHLRNMWTRIQQEEAAGWRNLPDRQELTAIDILLQGGGSILWNVYQYLYGDYDAFSITTDVDGKGEKDIFDKEVTLCHNGNANSGTDIEASQMQAVFLLQTQTELANLRYRLHQTQRDTSGTTRRKVTL